MVLLWMRALLLLEFIEKVVDLLLIKYLLLVLS